MLINGAPSSAIEAGMLILLGINQGDTAEDAQYLAERSSNLRIFNDQDGKMNLSLRDVNGSALVVSQFTLYGDTSKGNRPSYGEAAPPEIAEPLYQEFVEQIKSIIGEDKVATGVFRAMMQVELVNDGPVTILLESKHK